MVESVYIHIPFCLSKKCVYCDFVSMPYSRSISDRYLDAVSKEMSLCGLPKHKLATLFIGGGTPTSLDSVQLKKLFKTIGRNFDFHEDAEITIEANPATVDAEKLRVLLELGVNRISLGVQSFNDAELKLLGRIHSSTDALEALDSAKKAGFENGRISIDLIYGIPGQNMDDWRKTLDTALMLGVTHISAYELTLEENTPLSGLVKKGPLLMPEEDEMLRFYFMAEEALENAGFIHYEISNYAMPGHESRHNMNYWRRGEYLGFGAAAHSFKDGKRWGNNEDVFQYMELLEKDRLPAVDICELTPEDAKREFVFLGLRTREGIFLSLSKVAEPAMPDLFVQDDLFLRDDLFVKGIAKAAAPLIKEGLLQISGCRLHATHNGFPLLNSIILRLLAGAGL